MTGRIGCQMQHKSEKRHPSALTKQTNRRQMDKTLNQDNPDSKRKARLSAKVLAKLKAQATDCTALTYRCNHQMLQKWSVGKASVDHSLLKQQGS